LLVRTRTVGPHEATGAGLLLLALVWISWAAGESLAYVLLKVSIWDWYAIAILFAIGFAAFAFALWVISAARSSPDPAAGRVLFAAFLAAATAGSFLIGPRTGATLAHWAGARRINGHLTSYQKAIDFIRSDAPSGAVIAISEPGTFGFKLGPAYRIVDELGLVSPGVARALAAGDMDYPFRVWKPQYIVLTWRGPYTPEGRPWLAGDYVEALKFTDPYWTWNHLDGGYVYRRKPGH
jgi:arabinofuranosyltransferase